MNGAFLFDMTTFEQIQSIHHTNVIEHTLTSYHMEERNNKLIEELGRVNLSDLTINQVETLGWPTWSDDLPIILIPLYLYDFLDFGQTLTCIDGEEIMVAPGYNKSGPNSNYIDNDNRGGFLAYGFYPK